MSEAVSNGLLGIWLIAMLFSDGLGPWCRHKCSAVDTLEAMR